jgi:hypothetical protein
MLIYGAQLLGAGSKFGKAKYTRAPSMNSRIGPCSKQRRGVAMTITLADGGIETRIIYEFKHAIGDFESF